MKCKKCGEQIPEGRVYCSVCGSEVQLVPDYNLLDDDILSGIIQREAGDKSRGEKRAEKPAKKEKAAYGRRNLTIGIICAAVLAVALASLLAYQAIQKQHQNSYDYQYQKAEDLSAANEWEEAVLYYKRSLELMPGDSKASKGLCDAYLALNDEDGAVAVLEELVLENPQDLASMEKLVGLYDKNGEYDKILALSKEAAGSGAEEIFKDYLVEPPVFEQRPGTYSESLSIGIFSQRLYDIFYTADGSDPAQYGLPYDGEISLEEEGTTTLLAVARNEKGIYSEVAQASYTIRYLPPKMPKVTPAGGTYEEAQMITVQVPENCRAYYTWDGSDPTENSPAYTGPLEMMQGNRVLSVILVNSSGLKSCVYRVNYVYMP